MPDLVSTSPSSYFGVGQCSSRPLVAVLRLHLFEQARYGLHVVVEDLRAGIHHDLQRFQAAFEIGDQYLDRAPWVDLAYAADEHGEDRRAAVYAVVAVDAGDHGVLQVHGLDRLGNAFWLQPVQRAGLAALDIAETARACAHIAHHQEGGCAGPPALTHVGAHCLFADGVQFFAAHQLLQPLVGLPGGRTHFDPFRAAARGGINIIGFYSVSGGCKRHTGSY